MVTKLRFIIQHVMFFALTYGGRFGIQFGHSLPCFSCPYVSGCGGSCYLMALQGKWWGLQMSLADMMTVMGLELLSHLVIFILLIILLNKFWCGWICPFGVFQDWLTYLRRWKFSANWVRRWRIPSTSTVPALFLPKAKLFP
jgi:ferredoxin-type protein NapH